MSDPNNPCLFCEGAKIIEQKIIYHGFQSYIKVINNR